MTIIFRDVAFAFYVFINSSNCLKQSSLGLNLNCLSKKCSKTNLKVLQYQILTSVKISEKQLPSKTKFYSFLQLSCSNFR